MEAKAGGNNVKREKLWTIIGGIGMMLFWFGACAADSENMVMPAMMIIAGLALCYGSAMKLEKTV